MIVSIIGFILVSLCLNETNAANSPVVFVPGVGGSQIEVKVTNVKTALNCQKTSSNFFQIWPHPTYINGLMAPCLNDYLMQSWSNGQSRNANGVEVRVKEFDKVGTLERLADGVNFISAFDYFRMVSDTLVSKAQLKKDVTIRGAPYDWRKGLNELTAYYNMVQRQVEDAYTKGGNTPVVMVGHSLGCLVVMKFLQTRTQAWKDKHVASFVSLNGPYGGAVKGLIALIHGFNVDIPILPAPKVREMQRTFLSTYTLAPNRLAFAQDFALFYGPDNKRYNLADLENGNIFRAIHYPEAITLNNLVKNDINLNTRLGVKLHCVIGEGVKTVNALKIEQQDFPNKVTELYYGLGDGTVNAESLNLCEKIMGTKQLKVHRFAGGEHTGMLKSDKFANLLVDIVANRV